MPPLLARSKQEIPLRHRQLVGWFADQELAVGGHGVGFEVDFDLRRCAVVDQDFFADCAGLPSAFAKPEGRLVPSQPSQAKLKRPPVEMWESGRAKPEALECGPLGLFPLLRHAPNCKPAGDGATLGRVKGVNNDAGRPVRFITATTIMVCADRPKETVRCHFMCATPRR